MNSENNFWKNKKVLITGHTGFKGSWLSLWLSQKGAKILGYSLEPENRISLYNQLKIEEKCISHIEDIRNKNTLKRIVIDFQPDIVFHLAAQPLVQESYKNSEDTWSTNVMGTIYLLNSLRKIQKKCVAIIITTDKVYKNNEWLYGYRENDQLGGIDPYSSSKAAVEIAASSWRASFCGNLSHQTPYLKISTARAGNVIGGGDWSRSRIIPDLIYGLNNKEETTIRNPMAERPWQHILEPLSGYLKLAKLIYINHEDPKLQDAFNFGPHLNSNISVRNLVNECQKHWDGTVIESIDNDSPYEAKLLNLSIDKAISILNWFPVWDFKETVKRTILWYKKFLIFKEDPLDLTLKDIEKYESIISNKDL